MVTTVETLVDGNKNISEGLTMEKGGVLQDKPECHFFHKTCPGHLNLEVLILHNYNTCNGLSLFYSTEHM